MRNLVVDEVGLQDPAAQPLKNDAMMARRGARPPRSHIFEAETRTPKQSSKKSGEGESPSKGKSPTRSPTTTSTTTTKDCVSLFFSYFVTPCVTTYGDFCAVSATFLYTGADNCAFSNNPTDCTASCASLCPPLAGCAPQM